MICQAGTEGHGTALVGQLLSESGRSSESPKGELKYLTSVDAGMVNSDHGLWPLRSTLRDRRAGM